MSQSDRASAPTLTVVDGIPTTTSVDVARHFGRDHKSVLRAIENLRKQLSPERQRNFALTFNEVPGPNGATRHDPAYRITRDGFVVLAMGFIGKKALAFKLAYIDAFNKMEAQLSTNALQLSAALQPSSAQTMDALTMGLNMANYVQRTVARALLDDPTHWAQQRWVLSFLSGTKRTGPVPLLEPLAPDTLVLSKDEVIDMMADISAAAWVRMRNKKEQS